MIDFGQWIDLRAFFVAFIIGSLFAYLRVSRPKVVYRYPTPWNAGKVTYIDEADVCYKYRVTTVSCPADKSKISEIPLQFRENQDIPQPNALETGTGIFTPLKPATSSIAASK